MGSLDDDLLARFAALKGGRPATAAAGTQLPLRPSPKASSNEGQDNGLTDADVRPGLLSAISTFLSELTLSLAGRARRSRPTSRRTSRRIRPTTATTTA